MLCLLILSACRREPDFDERYDAANEQIRNTAKEIDEQIAGTATSEPEDGD